MVAAPAPRTWADGEEMTGARANLELRDQLRLSALHIAASRGQMFYAVGTRELGTLDPPATTASALYHPGGAVPPQWRAATAANLIENGGLTAAKMGAQQAAQAIGAGEITNAQIAAGAAIANIGVGGIDTTELADDAATARTIEDGAVVGKLTGSNRLTPDAFDAAIRTRLGLSSVEFFELTDARTGLRPSVSGLTASANITLKSGVSASALPFDAVELVGETGEYSTQVSGGSFAGAVQIGPGNVPPIYAGRSGGD